MSDFASIIKLLQGLEADKAKAAPSPTGNYEQDMSRAFNPAAMFLPNMGSSGKALLGGGAPMQQPAQQAQPQPTQTNSSLLQMLNPRAFVGPQGIQPIEVNARQPGTEQQGPTAGGGGIFGGHGGGPSNKGGGLGGILGKMS